MRPSPTRRRILELYRAFKCGAIVHTHSEFATSSRRRGLPIRCMGTTHADYFHGDVPVTRAMTKAEVDKDYEANTGKVIVETLTKGKISPDEIPAVLVANHAPFAWGTDASKAIELAEMLEFIRAESTGGPERSRLMRPKPEQFLIDKHYLRKHGKSAYYGQK
jgi:L-ribulose-5-phosphate 4-epimerase